MATYYVKNGGSDAASGLTPALAWATLGKALGAAGIASGDTVKVAPGTYREVVTVAMTSAVAETIIEADVANESGFSGITAGPVIWTAYTTNDKTTPSTSPTLNLNGRDFLTFKKFVFVGANTGSAECIGATAAHSTNIKVQDCVFLPGRIAGQGIAYTGLADTAAAWTVERCRFIGFNPGMQITLPTSAIADYDANFQIINCDSIGPNNLVTVTASGALAFKGGGVDAYCCSGFGSSFFITTTANVSTTIPCTVNGCVAACSSAALNANTSGQIVEDYNYLFSTTPRTNVSAGANSQTGPAWWWGVEAGQTMFVGSQPRPFLTPTANSPLLNFGTPGGAPTVDILNRPRPSGGDGAAYAAGALERHDPGVPGGAANAEGATGNCIQLGPGPGDQDLFIPVDAASTTISIKQKTASYGGANYPQITLVANPEIGVATQTVADSSAAAAYTTLTLAAFTPSAKGVVTLRLQNRTNDGAGIVYFDTLSVT